VRHIGSGIGLGTPDSDRDDVRENRFERRLTVAGRASIRVVNVSGGIRVLSGEPGSVTVRGTKLVHGAGAAGAAEVIAALDVSIVQTGDAIAIEPRMLEPARLWRDQLRGRRASIDFELVVPEGAAVDVQNTKGAIVLAGVRGAVVAQNVTGRIALEDVRGPMRLRTVSGDVIAERVAGPIEGSAVSGSLSFRRSRLWRTDVQTVSGDVTVEGDLAGASQHRLRTISGDVSLALSGSSFRVDYRSLSGALHASRGDEQLRHEQRYMREALVGDGRVVVQVRTTSGPLSLLRAAEPDVPRDAPDEPAQSAPDSVRTVLERLARGEIRVDEAAAELDAPRSGKPREATRADGAAARGRTLRIRVTEGGAQKVDIAVPLAVARAGTAKLGGLVRGHLAKLGVDLDQAIRDAERTGRLVDAGDATDRLEIFID